MEALKGAYVIFLRDESCNRNICSWQSRKVRRVVKSTLAAETLALLDGAEASILLAAMISELLNLQGHRPIVKCFVDNRSLVDAVYSTKVIEDRLLRINMGRSEKGAFGITLAIDDSIMKFCFFGWHPFF